jgi:hypothetical protein
MIRSVVLTVALAAAPAFAALTEEQRVQDFQTLSAIYAKRYAPANWKIQSLGVNPFEVGPWVARVRAAKSDLEFVEIMMRYVASFQDTHDLVTMPSNFVARTGLTLDLYDNKAVIELIDRSLLPAATYPFVAGDEVVSVDGRPALDIARDLAALRGWGNPRGALRWGVGLITARGQSTVPFAVDLPGESAFVIRRQSGDLETHTIKWTKTGFAVRELGGVPSPSGFHSGIRLNDPYVPDNAPDDEVPTWKKTLYERFMYTASAEDLKPRGESFVTEDGVTLEPRMLLNLGSRFPWFAFPAGFQQRLGSNPTDIFFSGTYPFDGQRIGYLRVPSFPTYSQAQINQLSAEITFMNANTDGLVVDVARNTGGSGCSVADLASFLIPRPFREISVSYRPYLPLIVAYDNTISSLQAQGAPSWAIEIYRFEQNMLKDAYFNGRGLTGPIPICSFTTEINPAPNAYRKPLIVLTDDFTISAGDLFAATMQDNKRGPLVGTRTSGAGGAVVDMSAGWYSETSTRATISLMIRLEEREYPGLPKSPYVEHVGVRPDIDLEYLTVENITNSGRPYSTAFSRILVEEIRKAQP